MLAWIRRWRSSLGLKKIEGKIADLRSKIDNSPSVDGLIGCDENNLAEMAINQTRSGWIRDLKELETKREFAIDRRNAWFNVVAMGISLFVAFFVPPWEQSLRQRNEERAAIQSLYQTIIANGDIFSSNYNDLKRAVATSSAMFLPEPYIEFPIQENVHKVLQNGLGINQYRFLLYYLNQTLLLTQLNQEVRIDLQQRGPVSARDLESAKRYQKVLDSLDMGGWKDSKFNYTVDTECLTYIFQKTFDFIAEAKRDSKIGCRADSLNRLYYQYGFIPDETPKWLLPELRAALNIREPGLGDRLIQPFTDQGL
jgi:hypothetical protein